MKGLQRIGRHVFQPVMPWVAESPWKQLPRGWTAQSRLFPDVELEMSRVESVLEHLQNRVTQKVWWQQKKDFGDLSLVWKPDATTATLRRWEQAHPECLQVAEVKQLKRIGRRLVIPPVDKHSGEMALI